MCRPLIPHTLRQKAALVLGGLRRQLRELGHDT
jgi:hypothetical protein